MTKILIKTIVMLCILGMPKLPEPEYHWYDHVTIVEGKLPQIDDDKDVMVKDAMYGNWLVTEYVDSAYLLDLNPLPENYNSHINLDLIPEVLNTTISFNDDTIIKYSAPAEMGYFYEDADSLHAGYKFIRIGLKDAPIIYVEVEHKDHEKEVAFMADGCGNTFVEIDYNFYRVVKLAE